MNRGLFELRVEYKQRQTAGVDFNRLEVPSISAGFVVSYRNYVCLGWKTGSLIGSNAVLEVSH